jgi:hypothetical protein
MLTGEEPEREGLMENDGRTGNDVPRFDPITGEPLNEQQMRFDPQAGRPISAGTKDNFNITFDTIYVDGIDIISLISEVLPYVLQDGMEDFAGDVGEILNSLSVGVSFSKKANVSRIEVGSDAVDLGAASEDDVEEMSVNILNDLGLSWLLNLYGY